MGIQINGNTDNISAVDGGLTVSDLELNQTGVSTFHSHLHVADQIIHLDDANTKMRFPAADTISFETAGNERLRVDSSGRLLYGLTSSTRETSLILQGNSNSYTTNPGILELRVGQVPSAQSALGSLVFGCTGDKIGGTISAIADNADWSSGSSHPTALRFFTTPASSTTQAERLRIDSTGQVSIGGNSSVGTKVHVENSSGDAHIRLRGSANCGVLYTRHSDGALIGYTGSGNAVNLGSSNLGISASLSGGNIIFQTGGTASSNERARIGNGGPHLLLGGTSSVNEITESSANAGMVIGGTGFGNGGLAIINSTSGTGRIYFGDATGSDAARNRGQINYYHNGDYMMFATAGSERLRIDSSGNMGLGIGGAISDARFRIKGANNTTSSFNDGLMVTSNNETVYKKYSWMGIEAQGGIIFSEATSSLGETMRIDSNGYVTKGNTPGFLQRNMDGAEYNSGMLKGGTNQYNTGNHYNTSTAIFTAPVAGRYAVGCGILVNSGTGRLEGNISLNNSTRIVTFNGTGTTYDGPNAHAIVNLAANDNLRVLRQSGTAYPYQHENSYFYAYLIG